MFGFLKRFRTAPPSPRRSIQIVERELASLTTTDWRQDKALCAQSRNVLSSPLVRQMIAVLHNSHPAFVVMTGDFQARALQQARGEGYTMALADLEAMGSYVEPAVTIPAEFAEEAVTDDEAAPFTSKGRKVA